MKFALNLILIASLTSCASLSHQPANTIAFADIEKLELGKATKDQILSLFGKPDETLPRSNTKEAWIYDGVLSTGAIAQKASFSFDGNILVGMLWTPYDSDTLQNAEAVQKHFKHGKFTRKVKGWDKQGHSYSDDASYYDQERGILFTTSGRDQTVSAIGFNLPSVKQNLSSKKQ